MDKCHPSRAVQKLKQGVVAVAATDEAVIEPFVGAVPWTVTVSPGFSPLSEDVALRVTVAAELNVTLMSWPLEFVT